MRADTTRAPRKDSILCKWGARLFFGICRVLRNPPKPPIWRIGPLGQAGRLAHRSSILRQAVLKGRRASLVTWMACVGVACQQESVAPLSIERLAFVPGGQITVGGVTIGSRTALLVDRFEITRSEWRAFARTELSPGAAEPLVPGQDGDGEWPAVGMDLEEAQAFAGWRGMRLPEVSEWLWIAAGPRAMAYPYDISPKESAANSLDLGIFKATPVGTFYDGRTPGDSIFDLEGNASEFVLAEEWTSSSWLPHGENTLGHMGTSVWGMGGSYLTHSRPLYRFQWDGIEVNAVELEPGYRASDLGLRCLVEAEVWLEAQIESGAEAYTQDRNKVRIQAVGTRWGGRAVELLVKLQVRHPDVPMIRWLLKGARDA